MSKRWKYFIFLLWISYLLISGILLFARGFLLSRDAFTDHTECLAQNNIPCTPAASSSNNITNGHEFHCSQQDKLSSLLTDVDTASKVCFPAQAKVILIIVDALRYDFTEFNQELDEPLPYQNKLPVISEMLKARPTHSRLFKFIADPPTTTMQRLKALTTGSLPTFVDAGSNFATAEINEDNLIDQMVRNNKSVVFMGDDTWEGLYPNRFKRCWNFPSFNVWDLDTVDRGIEKNIFTEMPKSDWDLLITHFLGVDHCGHRYGPNHPEMARKLSEINQIIKKVIEKMDDKTMLFIIGDHGMTKTGDHGGDSEIETTAAMFIHSAFPLNQFDSPASVKQIDMIPTLSTILGIPIPFSNLGTVIFDALPSEKHWQTYLKSLWANVRQTHNYIKTYSERSSQFSDENLQYLIGKYENLKGKVNKIKSEGQFKSFVKESREFLKFLQNMCEDVWVQFDSYSMTRGLLLLFLTLFFTYLIIDGIPNKKLSKVFMGSFIVCSLITVLSAAVVTLVCYYLSIIENIVQNIVFSTGMVSIFMLTTLVVQHWEDIAINWYESVKKSWLDTFTRVTLLLVVCTLFSNSYVVEEASVFSYLILSLVVFIIYSTNSKNITTKIKNTNVLLKLRSVKFKIILAALFAGALLRISSLYWTCREEQKWCMNFTSNKASDTTQCVLAIIILAVLVTSTKLWLRSCGNLVGFSPTVMTFRYAPTVAAVCSGGYWVLQRLSKEPKNPWQIDSLAWVVFGLSTAGIVSAIVQPLCVYMFPRRTEAVNRDGNVIPQLFKQMKESLGTKNEETPVVCGLATVYSANFIVVSVFVCLVLCLLLGSTLAPSGVVMYFTAALLLLILATAQQHTNNDSFDVPNWSIVTWSLLSTYFFYGSGHAAQFPSIHWNSGFVGRTGGSWGGELLAPALLVTLETFCSQLLLGLLLPMLLVAPHTLTVMFPALCARGANARAEIALFEREDDTFDGLFALCCKYFLCHGIRMFACSLAATIHCRHLMVWKIFAPKFMFETASIFVTLISVLAGYLIFIRIHCRLGHLLNNLYKRR